MTNADYVGRTTLLILVALWAILSPAPAVGQQLPSDRRAQVDALIKRLTSLDEDERRQAARALAELKGAAEPAAAQLIERLSDEGKLVAREASLALAAIGAAAVPSLVEALDDEADSVRWWAASAIEEIGPEAREAIPALVAALGESERPVPNAPAALASIGMSAVGPALGVLKDPESSASARAAAAQALGAIGPRAKVAVPALIEALGDRSEQETAGNGGKFYPLAHAAAYALGSIGPEAAEAVNPLAKVVGDPNSLLSSGAIEALGAIGPTAVGVVPALIPLLKSSDHEVSVRVARTLGQIGPPAHSAAGPLVEALIALNAENESARQEIVAEALSEIGPPAIEPLVVACANGRVEDKPRLIRALGLVVSGGQTYVWITPGGAQIVTAIPAGPEPEPADVDAIISTLLAALAQPDSDVRTAALEAIVALGPAAAAALPAVVETLQDREAETRIRAATALLALGTAARPTVPDLLELLADRSAGVRHTAVVALAALSSGASEVTEALTTVATKDRDRDVRAAAGRALRRVQGMHRMPNDEQHDCD